MHLLVIAIVALVVLGPKRLPEAGKTLGKGMREFKDALSSRIDSDEEAGPPVAVTAAAPVPVPAPAPVPPSD